MELEICYHARHASFTGGIVTFFPAVSAGRAGKQFVLALEKMGTCSIAIVFSSPGGQKKKMRRSEVAYILEVCIS